MLNNTKKNHNIFNYNIKKFYNNKIKDNYIKILK